MRNRYSVNTSCVKGTYQQAFMYERHLHVPGIILNPRASTCCVVLYAGYYIFLGKASLLKNVVVFEHWYFLYAPYTRYM
jgi:hypothetical protein